jgi:hypothetical protein
MSASVPLEKAEVCRGGISEVVPFRWETPLLRQSARRGGYERALWRQIPSLLVRSHGFCWKFLFGWVSPWYPGFVRKVLVLNFDLYVCARSTYKTAE